MSFQLEKEMTPIVRNWMIEQGYIVHAEVFYANNCDLLGCQFNIKNARLRIRQKQKTPLTCHQLYDMEMAGEKRLWMPLARRFLAVELKLSRIAEVIDQARVHKYYAEQCYIAMPARIAMKSVEKAHAYGVGVIAVNAGACEICTLPAERSMIQHSWLRHRLAETFWRYHRNEIKEPSGD